VREGDHDHQEHRVRNHRQHLHPHGEPLPGRALVEECTGEVVQMVQIPVHELLLPMKPANGGCADDGLLVVIDYRCRLASADA